MTCDMCYRASYGVLTTDSGDTYLKFTFSGANSILKKKNNYAFWKKKLPDLKKNEFENCNRLKQAVK